MKSCGDGNADSDVLFQMWNHIWLYNCMYMHMWVHVCKFFYKENNYDTYFQLHRKNSIVFINFFSAVTK